MSSQYHLPFAVSFISIHQHNPRRRDSLINLIWSLPDRGRPRLSESTYLTDRPSFLHLNDQIQINLGLFH